MERIDSILAAAFEAWEDFLAKLQAKQPEFPGGDVAFSDELERQLIARELHA